MKLAISTMSYLGHFSDRPFGIQDFLKECLRLGVTGVEIQDRHVSLKSSHPAEEIQLWKNLRKEIIGYGLEVAAFSPELFFDNLEEKNQRIAKFLELIDSAVLLETKRVRIFPALLSTLKTCTEYAEKKDVVLVLENHGGETNTAEGHIGLVKAVGSRALQINLDTGNYPENSYENIKKAIESGYVAYMHVKHYGYGERSLRIDHEKIFAWLKEYGYDGWLAVEYEGPRYNTQGKNIEKEVVEKITEELQGILASF